MFYTLLCTLVKLKGLNSVLQIINHSTTVYKKFRIIKEIISPDMQKMDRKKRKTFDGALCRKKENRPGTD